MLVWAGGLQAQPVVPDVAFAAGVAAFEADRFADAQAHFEAVWAADPAYVAREQGSAAYWLGRVQEARQQPMAALDTWAAGWDALARSGRIDLRLADALVWQVFERADHVRYATAASAYLTLLEHLDGPQPEALARLYARHLIPLTFILPGTLLAQFQWGGATDLPQLPEGMGAQVVAWWRSMDVLPATWGNERLKEHLERVVYAHAHYRSERDPSGFDDRGRIYIRFGPPSHQTPITFDQIETGSAMRLAGAGGRVDLNPTLPSFPRTEFWVYRHMHEQAQYLFVHRDGRYRLSIPFDLLPPTLRRSSQQRALLKTLEHLYKELALYHPQHYGARYQQIAAFVDTIEPLEFAYGEAGAAQKLRYYNQPQQQDMIESVLLNGRTDDRKAARRRDESVPASYSNLLDEVETLPVGLRWARFMDPNGNTRTELYWSLPPHTLHPSKDLRKRLEKEGHKRSRDYVLNLTVAEQTEAYRTRRRHFKHYQIPDPPETADNLLAVRTLTVRGDQSPYHLALQWDTHWVHKDKSQENALKLGPTLKLSTRRIDSLAALRATPDRLEMSDLKLLRISDPEAPLHEAAPYPFYGITRDMQLALYFELYHLTFGADDQAHYTVAFEVTRQERNGTTSQRTIAETRYTHRARTAGEHILLDFSNWETFGETIVTLRVTDETSGQSAARSVRFDVKQ